MLSCGYKYNVWRHRNSDHKRNLSSIYVVGKIWEAQCTQWYNFFSLKVISAIIKSVNNKLCEQCAVNIYSHGIFCSSSENFFQCGSLAHFTTLHGGAMPISWLASIHVPHYSFWKPHSLIDCCITFSFAYRSDKTHCKHVHAIEAKEAKFCKFV